MELEGKVAVITGASRGVGRELAVGFAREGAFVVAAARTIAPDPNSPEGSLEETVSRIQEQGGKALAVQCDVSDEASVKNLVERTLAEVGPIDVLINNAGIAGGGNITEMSVEEFDRVMAVNVRGIFLMCKYVTPGMMERKWGSIMNLSSRNAIWDTAGDLVYGPSKAALNRFSINLSVEMKPYNIAVNALGPGLVATEMTKDFDPSMDNPGRMPEPAELVVPAALWLAQQDASTFTGRVVHRDEFRQTWP